MSKLDNSRHWATLGQGPTHNYPHLSAASCLGSQAPHAATLYLQTIYTTYISTLQHRATHGQYNIKGCKGPKKWSRNIDFADIMNRYRCLPLNLNKSYPLILRTNIIHPLFIIHCSIVHNIHKVLKSIYMTKVHNVPFYLHPFFEIE